MIFLELHDKAIALASQAIHSRRSTIAHPDLVHLMWFVKPPPEHFLKGSSPLLLNLGSSGIIMTIVQTKRLDSLKCKHLTEEMDENAWWTTRI